MNILFVEDNKLFAKEIRQQLQAFGNVHYAMNLPDAIELINQHNFDVAFVDLYLGKTEAGTEIIRRINVVKAKHNLSTEIFVITNDESEHTIDKIYSLGVDHYFTKTKLGSSINGEIANKLKAINLNNIESLIPKIFCTEHEETVADIKRALRAGVNKKININFEGPSGSGKTYASKQIAMLLDGDSAPFQSLNISELSSELVESQLFGHEKGAFTGAISKQKGIFQLANNGSLFLDEIQTLEPRLQVKLLKPLDEKIIRPAHGELISLNVRVMTGTNENLLELVERKKFRLDLYERLKGTQIRFFPLKYRKNDILLLIENFKSSFQKEIRLTGCAHDALMSYDWPGNIRELSDVFNVAVETSSGKIDGDSIIKAIKSRNGHGDKEFLKEKPFFDPQIHGKFLLENDFKTFKEEFQLQSFRFLQQKFSGTGMQAKICKMTGMNKSSYKLLEQKLQNRELIEGGFQ